MTTKKIVIAGFALFTIAIFAGCEAQSTETNEHENILKPPTGSMQTSFSLDQTQQASVITQVSVSAADQAAYTGAMQLKDTTFCDKITDADYKSKCKTDLADAATLDEAMTKKDAVICDKLSTKDQQDACKIQVEVLLKRDLNMKTQQEAMEAQQTASNSIIRTGDYARCKELKDTNQISSCEMNILVNKVLETKDLSWCDKASEKTTVENCKLSVGPKIQ